MHIMTHKKNITPETSILFEDTSSKSDRNFPASDNQGALENGLSLSTAALDGTELLFRDSPEVPYIINVKLEEDI